jgi:C-terminal processing protease CtpA/Prc
MTACGGSGGGDAGPFTPPPPETPDWQEGVFLDASTFAANCAAPRSGIDPATGSPYPDIQGTTLDENNFLRSFSNDTYLWYDEIVDQDPGLFNDPIDYFGQLKTFAEIAPGIPKDPDEFHFAVDSLEWFNATQGGVSAGYGAQWAIISATPPREVVVAYTEPNSPATAENLARGAAVLEIDGFDIDTNTQAGVDALNDGLFPAAIGETHDFTVRDLDGTVRQISMASAQITNAMVQNEHIIDVGTDKVGYMVFNFFRAPAEEELINAINKLINDAAPDPVKDLVLDIRYNGGGFGIIASQLAYMIAGPANTNGRVFDLLQFNDKHPSTNPVTGEPLVPDPFVDETSGFFDLPAGQPLPTLNLSRVFVLTGPGTCSASELVMNSLRGIDVEVIQIGSTTCGKPYGFYEEPNCGTSYFTIQFRSVNEKGFGDYAEGFQPSGVDDGMANILGCSVPDDYTKQLGDAGENRLEVALAFRDGQGCITPSSASSGQLSKTGVSLDATDGFVYRSLFDSNRIMLRP